RLVDLEVVLGEREVAEAGAAEGVREGAGDVEAVDVVAEGVGAGFGEALVALAGERGLVAAAPALAEVGEDLFEGALPERALALRGDVGGSGLLVALDEAAVLERLDEVAEAHLVVRQAVLVVELGEPAEGLVGVAAGMVEELLEEVEEAVERRDVLAVAVLVPLGVAEKHGNRSVVSRPWFV